ncbi:uncharacterized protein RHOBADRAFT_44943 [Rhodotorula graminis WP1]|uniref:Uncharacterized protein n=1 Tax=Rhodotorula graminis (strain WP1) TaxID=578459 RepID=A0A194S1R7_RHOGW|nr:uncharacterized protein RHOBADRAFT_44943 [Rhodotorula graminis WP1]KPV74454.1 hypothetical protein RHOBADRAFT_44943 [Rhodotorula graminis WP1]
MRPHLVHLLAVATLVVLVDAQTCADGTSLYTPPGSGPVCCITQSVVTGAICENLVVSGQPRTACYWTRRPDDIRFAFTIPQAIQNVVGVTLKGTHGEFLDNFSPDYNRQRGSIVTTSGFSAAAGRSWIVLPGSYYGRTGPGGGLPSAGTAGTRGVDWARGGGASALFGSYTLVAAGGGGQGPAYGLGSDADSGYYASTAEGEPARLGVGGGGAGFYGGLAAPYLYNAAYSCGSTFSPRTCYYPVYGPSAGGLSGSSGSFPSGWTRGGWNGDGSTAARLVTFTFACVSPEPTTTIRLPTPAATATATNVLTELTTTTAEPGTQTATVTVESARPPEFVDETSTPDPTLTTRTDTATTFPPESTAFSTFTPETSTFFESPTVTTTPATSTIFETFTPPTSFFTETVEELVTPATAVETVTTTPATRIIPTIVTELRTVSSGTSTSVVSTTTGSANCFHFRMVYPPACCPTAYIKGLKPWTGAATLRRRNVVWARDLTTIFTPSGTTTITTATTATSTAVNTPDPILVTDTATTPGPITTITRTETLEPATVVIDETATVEGVASTTTITLTDPAPSITVTETQYVEAATPLFTDVSTADAPSSTATETSLSTLETPRSTVNEEAPTPISMSTDFFTEYKTVPATTTTSTAYSRSTTCAVKPPLTLKCSIPALRGADQVVQVALIKAQKFLSGNRAVQIDCGSAGVWSYV